MTLIPVEEVRDGDRLLLPRGREVEVQRVDFYDDPVYPLDEGRRDFVIRYRAGNELGSFCPLQAGELVVRVARKLRLA